MRRKIRGVGMGDDTTVYQNFFAQDCVKLEEIHNKRPRNLSRLLPSNQIFSDLVKYNQNPKFMP